MPPGVYTKRSQLKEKHKPGASLRNIVLYHHGSSKLLSLPQLDSIPWGQTLLIQKVQRLPLEIVIIIIIYESSYSAKNFIVTYFT